MAKVAPELQYSDEHEWVARDAGSNVVSIGISAVATDALGDIVYVDLPEVGSAVTAGETCGEVESTKSVSDLYAPVTGEVTEINDAVVSDPALINSDPFAAGLGPVVALSKEGDFVGKTALAAKKEAGAGTTSGRKLVGLKGLGRRAGRGHYPVLKDGNVVGEVTSGQPSPTLGYPVAMAYVDVEFTEPGTALDIDLRGKAEPFEVVALPFYKRQK